jgi:hypothetical protein
MVTKSNVKFLTGSVYLIVACFIAIQPTFVMAQQQGRQDVSQTQNSQQQQGSVADLVEQRQKIKLRSTADLGKSSALGWQIVDESCDDPTTVQCAQAAIAEVNLECTESSKFFRKGSTTWTWINFGMIVGSSVFTGLGASTTLTNAKVFSTLGASTALGSVATTAMTNSTADQGGLIAINSTLDSFLKFVQSGGDSGKPADNALVYKSAPIYAAKCTSAASSTGH